MRLFTFLLPVAFAAGLAAQEMPFPLEEATVGQMRAAMDAGKLSSKTLTKAYLARIKALDPLLGSVIEINPEALDIAEALDLEQKTKGVRGPLHGIPVLLKDNLDTADRMHTTAGSLALMDSIPEKDAFVVARLRAAGAVILGKANLSEWANFRSSNSTSGWSARGGQCRNPYALNRNPSGSSSGSAAAVSANLAALAVGTETDGSIVSPASVCGLVGLKPTLGLLSRTGIVPISHSQDTAGPLARTVRDAAILLGAMTGTDPADPETKTSKGRVAQDYTAFLDAHGLAGARLGVLRPKTFGIGPKVDPLLNEAIRVLKAQGATVVEVDLPNAANLSEPETEVLLYEFKADLGAYLKGRNGKVKSLDNLVAFNLAHANQELALFGQDLVEQAAAKGPLTDKAYREALDKSKRLAREEGIDKVMEAHQLDALVSITNGPAWLTDTVNGDFNTGGCSTPAAIAGYPHLTIPVGEVSGLPFGLSFFGKAWSEGKLLRLGYAFEQATQARKAPTLKPSL